MSLSSEARRARFHQYGPWALVGIAAVGLIGFEIGKHHLLSVYEVLFFIILVPTIILHEVSHGLVVYWCGDDTAKNAGRLNLNPLRHVDIVGTILVPILLIVTYGRAFGWAKPVPISINKLRHPRNQAVLVGLAGPTVNILIALIAGFAIRILSHNQVGHQGFSFYNYVQAGYIATPYLPPFSSIGYELLYVAGLTNVFIATFNLIPIPPLDGSAVVERLLPTTVLPQYYRIRTGFMILVLLVVFFAPGALETIYDHAADVWSSIVF